MKTKAITGYAVRIMLYLAQNEGVHPKSEIVQQTKVPAGFFNKLMQELKKTGAVTTETGQAGGYRLNINPEHYSLWNIYTTFEMRFDYSKCQMCDEKCDVSSIDYCPIRKVSQNISEYFEKTLTAQTLSRLLHDGQSNYIGKKLKP